MANVEEFLNILQKSRLLTPGQWLVVSREAAGAQAAVTDGANLSGKHRQGQNPPTPQELAGTLVERRFVTRWQADMLLSGKKDFILGKYRLLDCVGTGGMGAVFKALHADLGRVVAIKILSPGVMKNRQAVRRFLHEIQAVAALDDPHIVAAYDAGTYGKSHFLVMEYVDGHDLGYLVKHESPLAVNWVCECIRQAALGLQHAHEQGLVHRDIKPTNLLVAKDSESDRPLVKILDLGLARFVSEMTPADLAGPRLVGEDGSLTQFGQFLGTPDYISPEQARDTRAADIRSDIFSLGCTFYRLLTGEVPFPGQTVIEKLELRALTAPLPVRNFRRDVSVELEGIIARMLARKPIDRYQTPREVAQALSPFSTGPAFATARPLVPEAGQRPQVPVDKPAAAARQARATGPRPPQEDSRLELIFESLAACDTDQSLLASAIAARFKRVSPRQWLAAASLAGLLLTSFWLWYTFSAATLIFDWPLDERSGAALTVNRRQIKLPVQQRFFVSDRPGVWDIRLQRDGFEPVEEAVTLQRGARVAFVPHWQPTPASLRWTQFHAIERQVDSAAKADALSPQAIEARTELLSFLQKYPAVKESNDARKLLSRLSWPLDRLDEAQVSAEERVQFANRAIGSSGPSLVGVFGDSRFKFWNGVKAAAISSDGRMLAGASVDGTVQVFALPMGQQDGRLLHVLAPAATPTELAFSPTGAILAIGVETGSVTLWNAVTGRLAATLADTAGPIEFSPDGTLIAVRAARQEIALWVAETGELRRTLQGHSTGVLKGLTFSHNGRMLASYGSDSSVLLWDVASGQERRRFPNAQFPQFSPDDGFLAAGATNGDLVLWDTRTGETQRIFDEGGYPLSFSNAGKTIISKRLGRAILWNLETGDEIRTLVEVPDLAIVSPDGKWLAGGDPAVGELRLWNLQAGGGPKVVNTAGPVAALACSHDSSTIVTGSRDGVVQIWNANSSVQIAPVALPLTAVDLSPDGRWLVARQGERVELIDVTTGQTERTMATGISELDALSFSPDGRLVAGYGGWGFFRTSLRIWDAVDFRELPWPENNSGTVKMIGFSADSQLLAVAGDSRLMTVWDVSKRTVRYDLDEFTDRITALAFHLDGQSLAVASLDQKLVLWNLKAGTGRTLPSTGATCRRLTFNHDGSLLAAATGERVLIWHLENDKPPVELATGELATGEFAGGSANRAIVDGLSIAFHPVGEAIAAADNSGCLWLWNDPARKRSGDEPDQMIRVGPAQGKVQRVLWSPEGRHILSVNGNGTIYVLRLKDKGSR
jgi:serine/threonine protein kinase/WD40 repeat protein